eukprot:2810438-Karenia_brevis.AAC.1
MPLSMDQWLDKVGLEQEDRNALLDVYLITFARALPDTMASQANIRDVTLFDRKQLLDAVIDSVQHPLASNQGGRPRSRQGPLIMKAVVFKESATEWHFHVALKLFHQIRFLPAKK